ncbi:MAG: AsmA family protein [Vicinamibacterales bacterium]
MSGWRRVGSGLIKVLAIAIVVLLLLVVGGYLLLQTAWGHNQVRGLIVSQANKYLNGTLEIERLGGSLFRGITLERVRLIQNGEAVVDIDTVDVSYVIRELIDGGTAVRRITLTRPRFILARQPDGQWNLAALVKRDPQRPTGPARPIRLDRVEMADGQVTMREPLTLGAAHLPSSLADIDTVFSFESKPGIWQLDVERMRFAGTTPELTVTNMSGVVGSAESGWSFRSLHVVTPRNDLTVDGTTDRRQTPSTLNLQIDAPKVAFQEWAGVMPGLRNLAVEAALNATLQGPPEAMNTSVDLKSTGGDVSAQLVLDTVAPGWHARGRAAVKRLDLSRWLNQPERPSDITGDVNLDVDLQLGGHFPVGSFAFTGSHAAYLEYEADDVDARGTITPTEVRISRGTATAYGANVRIADSTMAIDTPYAFHFVGSATGVDLRQIPAGVPVPRVASRLAFDYDVSGRFVEPYLTGRATFGESTFLDAVLHAGATGFVDTSVVPFHYGGEGALENVDLNAFGRALEIAWLQEPRYDGVVNGRFHVDGTGSDLATMTLDGGGRLERARLFKGELSNADVSVSIAHGTLTGSYRRRPHGHRPVGGDEQSCVCRHPLGTCAGTHHRDRRPGRHA